MTYSQAISELTPVATTIGQSLVAAVVGFLPLIAAIVIPLAFLYMLYYLFVRRGH